MIRIVLGGVLLSVLIVDGCMRGSSSGIHQSPSQTTSESGAILNNSRVVAPGASLKKLVDIPITTSRSRTEGPVFDGKGNLYFSELYTSRIYRWSQDGKLSVFTDKSAGANGLFFDKDGSLFACAASRRALVSFDSNGAMTVIADRYNGKRFNEPNDLFIDKKGGIYFSDSYWKTHSEALELDGEYVFYLTPDRKRVIRVIDNLIKPNGLSSSPDGSLLYITDSGERKTYVYSVNNDGSLSNKKLFAPFGIDGLTVDIEGNVYITSDDITAEGVLVFNARGNLIDTIKVPKFAANVCFGGLDKQTLYITAGISLYSIKMRVKGLFKVMVRKSCTKNLDKLLRACMLRV